MAYLPTQFDFPNTSNYDSDLRETLKLAKQLYNEYNTMYNGFLKLESDFADVNDRFTVISTRFDQFTARMNGLTDEINRTVDSKLAAEMVEVNNRINSELAAINRDIARRLDEIKRITDDFMAQIKALYDKDALRLNGLVSAAIASLDGRFDELAEKLRNELGLDYERNKAVLLYLIEEVREEYKRDIERLEKRLDEIIKEYPQIWNIAQGYPTDVESAVLNAYDALRYFANTVKSFDFTQATAAAIDGKDGTALWWDVSGREAFKPFGKCKNPINGKLEPICEVIDAVAEFTHDGRITAAEYQSLDLTANEYRAFDMTAYQYKFWSKYILTGEMTPRERLTNLTVRMEVVERDIVTINATLADHERRIQQLEM